MRKRFRTEKKLDAAKRAADDQIKGKYGLPETLKLLEDDVDARNEARDEWVRGRREHEAQTSIRKARLSSSAKPCPSTNGLSSLRDRILDNTRRSSLMAKSKPPDRKGPF